MSLSNRLFCAVALVASGTIGMHDAAAQAGAERFHFVNPEAASRVCQDAYRGRDGAYRIGLTGLGAHLFIEDREIARGVTSHATIGDPDVGLLYIVSTRLRGDAAGDRALLDRVEERTQAMAVRFPTGFTGKRGNGPFGRTFESTLINANKGSDDAAPFPITVGYTPPKANDAVESVAVHRHFVTQGYYFEVAVLLRDKASNAAHADGAQRGAELARAARAWLDTAMTQFTPGRFGACAPE